MSFPLNPMGINGPTSPAPYQQTDYRVPTTNANVASYPGGANMLLLTWPIPVYTQPNYPTAAVKTGGTLL